MTMELWRPRLLRRWRPFEDMEEMQREIENLVASAMAEIPSRRMWLRLPRNGISWAPALDLYEKDDAYIIRTELPGMKLDDIDISMSENTLTVKGERKPPADIKEEEYCCSEICYGKFSRSISLDKPIEADKIDAAYENGILEIHLPKAAEVKPAKIEIKAKARTKA